MLRKLKGFTLIELLIVIAIIAILTVAFLPTLRGGQAGARNAARKAAANDIVVAVERITNGDFVTATPSIIAAIPVVATGTCLGVDFGTVPGPSIRQALSRAPRVQSSGLVSPLCNGGYFYKSFESDGTPTEVDDVATNYLVGVQLEPPTEEGNVSGSFTGGYPAPATTGTPSAPTAANMNTYFDTWSNVLAKTAGTPTTTMWVVTK